MNILYLLTQDLQSPSGLGRYFPIAKELVRMGHNVKIVALHSNFYSLKETRFLKNGVEVKYVAQMHVVKQGNRKIYYPSHKLLLIATRATWALTHAALNIPAEIVHIGKPHPMNSIAGLITKRIQNKRVFLDCDDLESTSNHFSAKWQQKSVDFFENFTPPRVHHITTHNSFLQDRLISLGVLKESITYIPNCVDLNRFKKTNLHRIEILRNELGLIGKKVMAFIGSLSIPSHPIYLLLDTFRYVLNQEPNAILLMVGGGEEFDNIIEQTRRLGIHNAVRFCGYIQPAEIADYYQLADVVVDPVYDDPTARARLPLKLFESWISEVPFVTGDVGDRRFVLGSPPAGMLARPGDPSSLSGCILDIFKNQVVATELTKRGLERTQLFTWDRWVRKLEFIYLNAIEASNYSRNKDQE